MRVLLDECMPRRLRRELASHYVRTVVEAGWSGLKNGALLRTAAAEFDVLLTVDTNLEHQQDTARLPMAVIVLLSHRNDVDLLRPLMSRVRDLLPSVEPGRLYVIDTA